MYWRRETKIPLACSSVDRGGAALRVIGVATYVAQDGQHAVVSSVQGFVALPDRGVGVLATGTGTIYGETHEWVYQIRDGALVEVATHTHDADAIDCDP